MGPAGPESLWRDEGMAPLRSAPKRCRSAPKPLQAAAGGVPFPPSSRSSLPSLLPGTRIHPGRKSPSLGLPSRGDPRAPAPPGISRESSHSGSPVGIFKGILFSFCRILIFFFKKKGKEITQRGNCLRKSPPSPPPSPARPRPRRARGSPHPRGVPTRPRGRGSVPNGDRWERLWPHPASLGAPPAAQPLPGPGSRRSAAGAEPPAPSRGNREHRAAAKPRRGHPRGSRSALTWAPQRVPAVTCVTCPGTWRGQPRGRGQLPPSGTGSAAGTGGSALGRF